MNFLMTHHLICCIKVLYHDFLTYLIKYKTIKYTPKIIAQFILYHRIAQIFNDFLSITLDGRLNNITS